MCDRGAGGLSVPRGLPRWPTGASALGDSGPPSARSGASLSRSAATLVGMGLFLFLAFIVVPVAELAVIVAVAHQIGLLWTLITLFGFSILGSVLAKRQGLEVWRRVRSTLAEGEMPSS